MTEPKHKNVVTSMRLPLPTRSQIDELADLWNVSIANVITIAIDRMHREEIKTMNEQQARKLAEQAIQHAESDSGTPVAGTTVVGINDDGYYWVTDNGEEVDHLTREQAIEIIVENLTAE